MKDFMTREQLIEIAKVGFPDRVKSNWDFDNFDKFEMGGVFRLYDKRDGFFTVLPRTSILTIIIQSDEYIQFDVKHLAFNQYKAIKLMEKMKLIIK